MNKKGVTLIELIVVIAIVGIIATVIVNIFVSGNMTFNKSKSRSAEQMDVRLVIQIINKELRYATDIGQPKNKESLGSDGEEYKYIYFDKVSKKIMKQDGKNQAYELLKGNQMFNNVYFKVENTPKANDEPQKILKLSIESQEKLNENNYDGETIISLLNENKLETLPLDSKIEVIKYKK